MNTALNRTGVMYLTNKSGGAHAPGDVVIIDDSNAMAVKNTTTVGYYAGGVGVSLENIANNATGLYAFGVYVPQINLSSSASLGDLIKTTNVAKQAVPHAAPTVQGDFGMVLGTGTTPAAFLFGSPFPPVATGDVVGPGSATNGNLAVFSGTSGKLIADGGPLSGQGRTLIAENTPSGVSVTTFSSIPGTYKNLVLEFMGRGTQAAATINLLMEFNADTTAGNYRYHALRSNNFGTGNDNGNDRILLANIFNADNANAGEFTAGEALMLQYTNTNFRRTAGFRAWSRPDSTTTMQETKGGFWWNNTAAITQIDLRCSAGNFANGSVFRLYGEQ
jgi:hypothetical protein